jgi:3-hydroxybutyryl-CoA dehydratase
VSAPSIASVVREITQPRINSYANASGDHNPIHINEAFARNTPFEGTIAHGMLILALIGEMMNVSLGEDWRRSGKLKVRFKAATRPGDTITASASLSKENAGRAEYAVQCATQTGEVVIEGRASVTVPA